MNFPIINGDVPVRYVSHYQRVSLRIASQGSNHLPILVYIIGEMSEDGGGAWCRDTQNLAGCCHTLLGDARPQSLV